MTPHLWQKAKKKTKIMASGPITSLKTDRETMEIVRDFIVLGSKTTADGDCKRRFLLGRKVITNLDRMLKSKDISLPRKVCMIKLWF